jgi:hypothetical protein
MQKHLDSLGLGLSRRGRDPGNYIPRSLNLDWSRVKPDIRLEIVRRKLNSATRNLLEELDDALDIKKGLPNPLRGGKKDDEDEGRDRKKKKKHRKRERDNKDRPNPSPRPDKGTRPPIIRQPKPRDTESHPKPPKIKKKKWDSRVGYFVTLSDITWYDEAPKIQESPFVDIHFEEQEKQYLSLEAGERWISDWYETGVIRGLNVDVVGKHKLNYSKNGDFEV